MVMKYLMKLKSESEILKENNVVTYAKYWLMMAETITNKI